MFTFTVFTPTFNRATLLPKVYECLRQQTYRKFEWLVIDDGSSDETADLMRRWQLDGHLEIVYVYQSNRGKHVAFNRAVERARGELFLPLDSDDICVPDALERLFFHWQSIPEPERTSFSGVTCLCMDEKGRTVGCDFPSAVVDGYPVEFLARHRNFGEKWGFHRLDVLRQYPFPENPGERFVPEGLIWNRIGKSYKIRFVNEALRIYVALPDGLSSRSVELRSKYPLSTCILYLEYAKFRLPLKIRIKALLNYVRFHFHARRNEELKPKRLELSVLTILVLPAGLIAYHVDRMRIRGAPCSR